MLRADRRGFGVPDGHGFVGGVRLATRGPDGAVLGCADGAVLGYPTGTVLSAACALRRGGPDGAVLCCARTARFWGTRRARFLAAACALRRGARTARSCVARTARFWVPDGRGFWSTQRAWFWGPDGVASALLGRSFCGCCSPACPVFAGLDGCVGPRAPRTARFLARPRSGPGRDDATGGHGGRQRAEHGCSRP